MSRRINLELHRIGHPLDPFIYFSSLKFAFFVIAVQPQCLACIRVYLSGGGPVQYPPLLLLVVVPRTRGPYPCDGRPRVLAADFLARRVDFVQLLERPVVGPASFYLQPLAATDRAPLREEFGTLVRVGALPRVLLGLLRALELREELCHVRAEAGVVVLHRVGHPVIRRVHRRRIMCGVWPLRELDRASLSESSQHR